MTLVELLASIDDPRREAILAIYRDHEDLFHSNPGSSHNHQAWEGGLADHLADMMRLAFLEHHLLDDFLHRRGRGETLPFTVASALIVVFCHDAEKLYLYSAADPRCNPIVMKAELRRSRFLHAAGAYSPVNIPTRCDHAGKDFKEDLKKIVLDHWREKYDLALTEAEQNAIKYTHGEGADYRNDRRVMNELAAFVGNLDRTSARILYASGKDLG